LYTEAQKGTPSYRAPELLKEGIFDDSVDIWALGCIFYELACKRRAFSDDWTVLEYANSTTQRHSLSDGVFDVVSLVHATNLLEAMLQIAPKSRPNSRELNIIFVELAKNGGSILGLDGEAGKVYSQLCATADFTPVRSGLFSVTHEQNPFFVGRDALLEELYQTLSFREPHRYNHRVSLYGLGGVGKTQIALEYAYRHEKTYRYVFWLSAEDQTLLLSGFREIGNATGCSASRTNLREIAMAVLRWLRATKGWLLIIDNLDDVAVLEGYLPDMNGAGHTIITTRNGTCNSIPAIGLEVKELRNEDGVQLLLARLLAPNPTPDVLFEARKIVDTLAGLPLAIEQAAAFIGKKENIGDYLPAFSQYRPAMLNQRARGISPYPYSVVTTWTMSLERLTTSCPIANNLLQHLAFMNSDDILVEFLKTGSDALPTELRELLRDPFRWRQCIDALENLCLVRVFEQNGTKIRIHRLLQAVIQDQMDVTVRCQVVSQMIHLCMLAFPYRRREQLEKYRTLQTQVVPVLRNTQRFSAGPTWLRMAELVANYLYDDGFYAAASEWWKHISAIWKETQGPTAQYTLRSLRSVVRSVGKLGLHNDAIALCIEILDIQTEVQGEEHPETLASMGTLATLYAYQNRFEEEERLLRKTLDIRKRLLGDFHPDTLRSMESLAACCCDLGLFDEARQLLESSLNIHQRRSGPDERSALQNMTHMAYLYIHAGLNREAKDLFETVLKRRQRILGPEHPDTLWGMFNMGRAYESLGLYHKSADIYKATLEIRERVLGKQHPDTIESSCSLAVAWQDIHRHDEARELHEKTWKARSKVLGHQHPQTLMSMFCLGAAHLELNRFWEARNLLAENLRLRTTVLGPDHPDTLWSIFCLGISCQRLELYESAEELHVQALKARTKVLGKEHKETESSLIALALTYQSLGRFRDSEELIGDYKEQELQKAGALIGMDIVRRCISSGKSGSVTCRDFEHFENDAGRLD